MTTENSANKLELVKMEQILEPRLHIEENIEDLIIHENGEAIFECKVDAHPIPYCVWYKNGQYITSSQRTKITCHGKWHRLIIKPVSTSDHGIYTIVCRSSHRIKSSKSKLFVIHQNLMNGVIINTHTNLTGSGVVKHLRNVKVESGTKIELEAVFENEIIDGCCTWFKDNQKFAQDIRTIILSSKTSSNLCVLYSRPTDAGIYFVVAKTDEGIVSTFADVQVITIEESKYNNEMQPKIKEKIPEELEINVNEEILLLCKVVYKMNTSVQWQKDGNPIEKSNFIALDYGNQYIGLKGVQVSVADSGKYTVVLRNEETGRKKSSSFVVIVKECPGQSPNAPRVNLNRPLESIVACCGSQVIFHCSYHLPEEPGYYVVWYLGIYKIEHSSSRFRVVCKGGEFLLYIEKLQPEMAGEVVCELRQSLPSLKRVPVSRTTARLSIVPPCVLEEEQKTNSPSQRGRIYTLHTPFEETWTTNGNNGFGQVNLAESTEGNGNGHADNSDVMLDITYCRLAEDGLYFLLVSRGSSEVVATRVAASIKRSFPSDIVVIQWDDSASTASPPSCWYGIEWGQGGSFLEAGESSLPNFEIEDPPMERIIKIRVKAIPPRDAGESKVTVVPASEYIMKPLKDHQIQPIEDFYLDYTSTKSTIGSGGYGQVELIQHNGSGVYYAAKSISVTTPKKYENALREFEMMRRLQHPKLVELFDVFMSEKFCIFVMDYLWGGELFERIAEDTNIEESDVVPYIKQICEALEYLHNRNIAHLDLKPENIICVSRNSIQVKIIDFGIARVIDARITTRGLYGTRDYVAPEVMNFESLTVASDMWSLGVIAYVMLSGIMPFAGDTIREISANITTANFNYNETAFEVISDLAKNFVDRLLVVNPRRRLSATEALNHQWIRIGPPKGAKASMRRARENLKSYLANYRARWQRAGNVMIAAHRLRTHAFSTRVSADPDARTSDRNRPARPST